MRHLCPLPWKTSAKKSTETANNWNFYSSKGHKSVKICPIIPTIELGLHVLCAHHICHTSQTHTTALSDAGLSREQIMSALEDTFRPCMKAFSVLINDWLLKIKAHFKSFPGISVRWNYFLAAFLIFTNTLKIFKEVMHIFKIWPIEPHLNAKTPDPEVMNFINLVEASLVIINM